MPRNRQDPSIRFADVIKIWEAAVKDHGTAFDTYNDAETTTFIYRLNQYRKIVRDQSYEGWTEMDRYVVRRGEMRITIEPRYVPDFSTRLHKLDGTPSTIYEPPKSSPLDGSAAKFIDNDDDAAVLTPQERKTLEEQKTKVPSPDAGRLRK